MPVIDSHHHFWRYSDDEYGWIPPEWGALRRDFLPDDLRAEITAAGVDGVVSVQARQSIVETEWLLSHAEKHAFIRAVVGWLPLVDPAIEDHVDKFASRAKLRGLRHVLQGEPDAAHMLRPDFERGVRALTRRGLAYDVLIFERHLPNAVIFADRHADATLIVDHVAKPRIAAGELEPWAHNLRELARRPHVACKLSGLVTEADVRAWTPASLRPYFEVVLDAFGPDRILFGTDWPVCLAACGYSRWKTLVEEWISPLSPSERAAILGGNALRLYRLP